MLRMSDKVTGECTISYNSDLNPTKKKEQRERERKVTLQWPWNYWFHRESLLEKRAQLLRVLTSLVPDHCFRGSGWIHSVVFIFAWQFSHQLARNISTPFAQQFPRRRDSSCCEAEKRINFLFVSQYSTESQHVCYSYSVECDQWHPAVRGHFSLVHAVIDM